MVSWQRKHCYIYTRVDTRLRPEHCSPPRLKSISTVFNALKRPSSIYPRAVICSHFLPRWTWIKIPGSRVKGGGFRNRRNPNHDIFDYRLGYSPTLSLAVCIDNIKEEKTIVWCRAMLVIIQHYCYRYIAFCRNMGSLCDLLMFLCRLFVYLCSVILMVDFIQFAWLCRV